MSDMQNQMVQQEIKFADIARFLALHAKTLLFSCFVGLLIAGMVATATPRKYEAILLMQVAQLGNNGNIEDPATLSQRLPLTISQATAVACGLKSGIDAYRIGVLQVRYSANSPNKADIRVRAATPEAARQCAESVFVMVKAQEGDLIEERLAGRRAQLKTYEQALQAELQNMKVKGGSGFEQLAYHLDSLALLRVRMYSLQEEIEMDQHQPARLIAPVSVSAEPVSPRPGWLLFLGMLAGFVIGILYSLRGKVAAIIG